MRAAPKALRLLPVFAIGLVTLLWPSVPATATTLGLKGPPVLAKVKVPPLGGTEPMDEDEADEPGRLGDDLDGLGVEVEESEDGLPSSATIVTPVGPAANVQLPATPSPSASAPATSAVPTDSGRSEPATRVAPPARRTTARSKQAQAGATASSTPRSLPRSSAAAASPPRDGDTSSRTGGRAKPESSGETRRSVVERIVDRVPTEYRLALAAVFVLAAGFAFASWRERRRALRAEAEALVDPLTGLANRRAFDRRLAAEWKRAERYGRPLGLVMLDLDGFKRLNDTRGHKEGDRVLREAAGITADRLREIDLAARLGGDEFAAICPETPSEGLDALAHSLERCLAPLPVGASIGFASREPGDESPLDMLERADAAMYRTKHAHTAGRSVALSS